MKLGVAIVGLGNRWEGQYLPAIRSLADRFEVRAVCEQVSLRAARAASELHAEAVDGFRVMAGREDVDAILCLGDQWYGTAPILAACDAGKAVYSAVSLPACRSQLSQLFSRVEASGVAFMAELARRHAPATVRLKELIATRLGRPKMLFCHHRLPQPSDPSKQSMRTAGGDSWDLLEMVDWCRYVVDREPSSVISVNHTSCCQDALSEYQMMSLNFPGDDDTSTGSLAQISYGQYIPSAWQEAVAFRPPAALQVACEHGIAFIDPPTNLVWFDDAGRHQESLENERPVDESMLLQFHRSTMSLVRRMGSLRDIARALQIVDAAARSQKTGNRIPTPITEAP